MTTTESTTAVRVIDLDRPTPRALLVPTQAMITALIEFAADLVGDDLDAVKAASAELECALIDKATELAQATAGYIGGVHPLLNAVSFLVRSNTPAARTVRMVATRARTQLDMEHNSGLIAAGLLSSDAF